MEHKGYCFEWFGKLELSVYFNVKVNFSNICIFLPVLVFSSFSRKNLEGSISRSVFGDTSLAAGIIINLFQ